jgi:hypothetical protein
MVPRAPKKVMKTRAALGRFRRSSESLARGPAADQWVRPTSCKTMYQFLVNQLLLNQLLLNQLLLN